MARDLRTSRNTRHLNARLWYLCYLSKKSKSRWGS